MTTADEPTPAHDTAATAHRVDWFDPQRPVSGTMFIRPDAVHRLLLEELGAARANVARLEAELAKRGTPMPTGDAFIDAYYNQDLLSPGE